MTLSFTDVIGMKQMIKKREDEAVVNRLIWNNITINLNTKLSSDKRRNSPS